MINPNWTKWILASFNKHIQTKITNQKLHFMCQIRPPVNGQELTLSFPVPDTFDVRYLGPVFKSNPQEYRVDLTVNIAIKTQLDRTNPFKHYERLGLIQNVFEDCIQIKKYGNVTETDDQSYVEHLRLTSEIGVTNFGELNPTSSIYLSTVEATYVADIRK